jgi:hypothetical protein
MFLRAFFGAFIIGLACAQYELTHSKTAADEVEYESRIRDKQAKTETELRMRLRTKTDDNTLEFEAESRSTADKTKVQARTRFNVRDVYVYADANANGLLDANENFTRYDLSNQWGAINCTTTTPYVCNVCNTGSLPANALCFEFVVTETVLQRSGRVVDPNSVKIGMTWDPTAVTLGANDHVALIGRFRSRTTFKDRQSVTKAEQAGTEAEDEQPTADGSTIRWEKRVFSPAGNSTEVKVGVYIPGNGLAEGTEQDQTDSSSMSFRQLQFSFSASDRFEWDPSIIVPTSGASTVIPTGLVGILWMVSQFA